MTRPCGEHGAESKHRETGVCCILHAGPLGVGSILLRTLMVLERRERVSTEKPENPLSTQVLEHPCALGDGTLDQRVEMVRSFDIA